MSRFLTKSRFKIGYECPTKLYYQDKNEFGNNNVDNSFLEALAEGGFQVGELAKIYIPGGIEIETLNKEEAVQQTAELMKREDVVIYEGCFRFKNLLIKADVVVRKGNRLELIEVKAKSIDPRDESPFFTKTSMKKGKPLLNSEWEPYILDAAFQAYVIGKVHPDLEVHTFLMLADKTATATVEGINQKFFLDKAIPEKVYVRVAPETFKKDLGKQLLCKISVINEINVAWRAKFVGDRTFSELVAHLSEICEAGLFAEPVIGGGCKSCEFRIGEEKKALGKKSGFENCWQHVAHLSSSDFKKPLIFDVWNFRKSQQLYEDGKIFMEQITVDDISPKEGAEGLTSSGRQWLQVQKVISGETTSYFDTAGLSTQMSKWKYPLHFIDFETTMVAIPFNKGRHPYEQMAFQFSHHIVQKDGQILHADQFLFREQGEFPNYEFVRALKAALTKDDGSIFRFAAHENTVLCQIRDQIIAAGDEVPDAKELIGFIERVTTSPDKSTHEWLGERNMIDMCELVKLFYYNPHTKGSNSIKKVLPAVLNESSYLQSIFSKPVYGTKEMRSSNFLNWTWVIRDQDGKIKDPYKTLPPVFDDLDLETLDSMITEGTLADGGAAMTAYARMQFTEMTALERDRITVALLKYCELDTFAMVLIYLHWKHEVEK
jgi:hypothetical protein